jgi:methylthioribose-1-phosphate isomerase
MLSVYEETKPEGRPNTIQRLLSEADTIREEDIQTNKTISRIGNAIVPVGATILTHCNTGALATAGWGTALGVIKQAFYDNKNIFVYADETRPRFQGARLTAWELMEAKIPSKLIVDSAAAVLIRDGKIDLVILGGDRVAANGDVANKLGTFSLSVICKAYGVPFYSVVPVSTIDFSIPDGSAIPIEEREASEVTHVQGVQVAPVGMQVYNPAFDVTPHQNLTGIITERGIIHPPFKQNIERLRRGETL